MFDEKLLKTYEEIVKDNTKDMTKLYCLSCVDASLKWLNAELATTDEERLHMASAVYDEWRDTDIQISKLSDVIVENWDDYVNDDDFNIYSYVDWGCY